MRLHQPVDDVRIYEGDVREALQQIPDESVQCVVTSPPYFGLRDYGVEGQIGLEPSVDEYVQTMVKVFREVRRVLRPDGTLWLNLGDSYNGSGGAGGDYGPGGLKEGQPRYPGRRLDGLKPKDLIGIPWRVAFALQADGWYLRSDIIWHKPNPMPESVTDRPTKAHEYLFLLSKSPQYYYDADAIREPSTTPDGSRAAGFERDGKTTEYAIPGQRAAQHRKRFLPGAQQDGLHVGFRMPEKWSNPAGRNKRSVWTVATKPFPEAHFATYPLELIKPCILAGTSPMACPHCGAPWERVVGEKQPAPGRGSGNIQRKIAAEGQMGRRNTHMGFAFPWSPTIAQTVGWQPTCSCEGNDGTGKSVILDPFHGSGTTMQVALELGRAYVGVELNQEYIEMSIRTRLRNLQPTLLGFVTGGDTGD